LRKSGEQFPIRLEARNVPYKGESVRTVEFRDITESKQAEEALKESENSLRLINSQKDLFFQILAHDLKNPLGAIYSTSEFLRERHNDYSNEKRQMFIDQLYNLSANTYSLLDELLLWGNSQAGKLSFQPKNIQLEPHLSELIKNLQPLANKKGISIHFSIPENTEVMADKYMLNVILRNLVTNAIKFTDRGGHIQINSATESSQVTITVADNGVGMDKETIDSIFKLDKKVTTTGTNNELGTGFGLKLCLEFVEKHGGKIWAESEIGKGSEFKFLLPLCNETQNVKD
jgi:signal transduction histidine kinase